MQSNITINKEDIYNTIMTVTAMSARNREGAMDRVSATDDEANLLDELYPDAFSSLLDILSPYFPVINEDNIQITVPANMPDVKSLAKLCNDAVCNSMLSEWYDIVAEAELAQKYLSKKNNNIINIMSMLVRREKPVSRI